jgi:hypothetical protein
MNIAVSDAQTCRDNGWGPGTRLVGDEGYGPTVIQITAVGAESILAKTVSHNGEPPRCLRSESTWTLAYRDWVRVAP